MAAEALNDVESINHLACRTLKIMKASFSYWERDVLIGNIDTVVIGGGIVGLTTAIHRKMRHPQERVLVVEADTFGGGGSTKNAGFACFGSPSEILSDLEKLSESEVIQLIADRWEGLKALRSMLGDGSIAYQRCGSVELFLPSNEELAARCVDQLKYLNELTQAACGEAVFSVRSKTDLSANYGSQLFTLGISNRLEGAINTGLMFKALQDLAYQKGVRVMHGVRVKGIHESEGKAWVHIRDAHLACERIFVCTNGFAKDIIPDLDVTAARNLVMVTEAIASLKWRGTFHMDEGHLYFRNIEDRLLIGGARHLDSAWNDIQNDVPDHVGDHLLSLLYDILLPGQRPKITHHWTGYLGLGEHRQPIVKRISERIAVGVKMGGMGVAIGSQVGKRLATIF